MKLLHTSDWHLGLRLCGAPFLAHQKSFIDQISKLCLDEKIDAILIAGDIFDNAVSSAEAIMLYDESVTKLCLELGIKAIICAGNHDGAVRLSSCSRLMEKSGLHVFGKIAKNTAKVSFDDTDIYVIPYYNLDEARYFLDQPELEDCAQAMKLMLERINKQMDSNKRNILMGHFTVIGGSIDQGGSDKAAAIGGIDNMPPKIFEFLDYVALGHLHKRQKMGKNIYYSGCPIKYSFSEVNNKNGVYIIDTNTMEIEEHPIDITPTLKCLKGTYDNLMQHENTGDYFKLILECDISSFERDELIKKLGNILSIEQQEKGIVALSSMKASEIPALKIKTILEHYFEDIVRQPLDDNMLNWFERELIEIGKADMQ